MTQYDDSQLVDYLFDEMSDEDRSAFERSMSEDAELSEHVCALDDVLDTYRELEDVEPSAHLDALILATARDQAELIQTEAEKGSIFGRFRKYFVSPVAGIVAAASVAAVAGIILVPSMMKLDQPAQEALPVGAMRAPAATPSVTTIAPQTTEGDVAKNELPPAPVTKTSPGLAEDEGARVVEEQLGDEFGYVRSPPKRAVKKKRTTRSRAKPRANADTDRVARTVAPAKTPAADPEPAPAPAMQREAAAGSGRGYTSDSKEELPRAALEKRAAVDKTVERKDARRSGKRKLAAPAPAEKPLSAASASAPRRGEIQRPADDLADNSVKAAGPVDQNERAAQVARDMIRAADQEQKRGQLDSARRILAQAALRTRGTPSEGDVLLRMAYLERTAGRYAVCVDLAERARRIRGFTRQKEAEALIRQVSTLIEPPTAPASASPQRE